MIDRDIITELIDKADTYQLHVTDLAMYKIGKAQALALVLISDLLKELNSTMDVILERMK